MWYKDIYGTAYWTSFDANGIKATKLPDHRSKLIDRPIDSDDQYVATFSLKLGEVNFEYTSYIISRPVSIESKKYPEYVNIKTLSEFMGTKRVTQLDTNKLLLQVNNEGFALSQGGRIAIDWAGKVVRFHITNDNAHATMIYFKQYAGKDFEFSEDHKIRTKHQDWVYLSRITEFEDLILKPTPEYKLAMLKFNRKMSLIEDYLESVVTCENITKLYGSLGKGMSIATRCVGCTKFNLSHVYIHLYRKELPFLLMLSVGDRKGNDFHTIWTLIEDAISGNIKAVEKFKKDLRSFLMEAMVGSGEIIYSREKSSALDWMRHEFPEAEHTFGNGDLIFNPNANHVVIGDPPTNDTPHTPHQPLYTWGEPPAYGIGTIQNAVVQDISASLQHLTETIGITATTNEEVSE